MTAIKQTFDLINGLVEVSNLLVERVNGTESRIIPVNYYKGCWYDCVFNRSIDDLETGFIRYWMSLPKPPEG